MILDCAGKRVDLSSPQVMGILNVTPDSFSDGGNYQRVRAAIQRAHQMVEEGAAIIDVGGESTRPGACAVSVAEELERVLPVIEALGKEMPVPISIDTCKPEVMREAVKAGAGFINDVAALSAPGAVEAAADCLVPISLMHMQGQPRTMQSAPVYGDVVRDVCDYLLQRVAACETYGIKRARLIIDPGFGFGKTLAHNLTLLKALPQLVATGLPVLVGISRKSMIGTILNAKLDDRVIGSVSAAVLAANAGAKIIRVHDVKETVEALKIVSAVNSYRECEKEL
ncbi:MAG: dihydropteroate synthase [Candidatus Polarisedimenticolaceae bacterium]|nr:dihydropteroate synthase [Candidatus Polarisedimenticolaceae bacterium]